MPDWYDNLRGKRTDDIHLPMSQNSRRDPRLGKPSKADEVREGYERVQSLVRGFKDATAPKKR